MNCKLFASELLCAALLLGCSSAPKLGLPSGDWVEINQPGSTPPVRAPAVASLSASPSSPSVPAISTPRAPVMFGEPPVTAAAPAAIGWAPPATPTTAATASKPIPLPTVGATAKAASATPPTPLHPVIAPTKVFPAASVPPIAAVVAPAVKPLPAPVAKQVWEARIGDSLRTVITNWSQRANYRLAWKAEDLDYPIDAPLRFEGSFEEAVAEIFRLYEKADRSFIVDGRRKQSRLEIMEDHDKPKRTPL